jgi:hypothetical protein
MFLKIGTVILNHETLAWHASKSNACGMLVCVRHVRGYEYDARIKMPNMEIQNEWRIDETKLNVCTISWISVKQTWKISTLDNWIIFLELEVFWVKWTWIVNHEKSIIPIRNSATSVFVFDLLWPKKEREK